MEQFLISILGAQYAWLKEELHKVDRMVTPWLVAAMHPPWYNSYSSHYQEFECMRLEMEELLYQYGVDIIFSGHVSWSKQILDCSNAMRENFHLISPPSS